MYKELIKLTPPKTIVNFELLWRNPQPKWASPGGRVVNIGDMTVSKGGLEPLGHADVVLPLPHREQAERTRTTQEVEWMILDAAEAMDSLASCRAGCREPGGTAAFTVRPAVLGQPGALQSTRPQAEDEWQGLPPAGTRHHNQPKPKPQPHS
ncbi:hypothetical protein B0H66DRAFT_372226 [Apodospora peruviana]|uniref:Uncharacterized protein n=1 Tax=Apodospora peruviana TaxID=516989 RepID=A0AAE0M102_9PEZI|nr:hypothetical protein B0H66DRAFT_372226 [Apodospora peruviana]